MTIIVNDFMKQHFNDLNLNPPLFYNWPIGIRFEIALPGRDKHTNPDNLLQIKERSTKIFEDVFNPEDDLFFVTDITCEKQDSFLQKKPSNIYKKYVRNKSILRKLQHKIIPDSVEEDMVIHRFVLPCKTKDIRYMPLFVAIGHEDFYQPATILKGHWGKYEIYLVNRTKKIIYHLYDDRGLDVIAANLEDLPMLYEKKNDWILDYDRETIDRTFKRNYK